MSKRAQNKNKSTNIGRSRPTNKKRSTVQPSPRHKKKNRRRGHSVIGKRTLPSIPGKDKQPSSAVIFPLPLATILGFTNIASSSQFFSSPSAGRGGSASQLDGRGKQEGGGREKPLRKRFAEVFKGFSSPNPPDPQVKPVFCPPTIHACMHACIRTHTHTDPNTQRYSTHRG